MQATAAATRKESNEDSCPLYKVSNDELSHIFEYVGEMHYGFVACTSVRFCEVYLITFRGEKVTSYKGAAISPSLAKLCLDTDMLHCTPFGNSFTHRGPIFQAAARDGKLDVLKWGLESGYYLLG